MKKRRLSTVSALSILSAILIHLALFFFLHIPAGEQEFLEDPTVFKLVDIEVYSPLPSHRVLPPPPIREPEMTKAPAPEELTTQAEETDKSTPPEQPSPSNPPSPQPPVHTPAAVLHSQTEGIEYLPAYRISVPPRIPVDQVLRKIEYPPQASRQRIEGVVYLELYIDREGVIRKMEVLKDPGYGFAEAAVKAFEGVRCQPAEANGIPVAVRYRYPIRFKLR